MKLTAGLVLVFHGVLAASQPAGEVYLMSPRGASTTAPPVTAALARLLLLQRLAPTGRGPSVRDFPVDTDIQEAVSTLNRFGKAPPPLFSDKDDRAPSQLVLMLEGMTQEQMRDMGHALGKGPALTIPDPPSAGAHDDLVDIDFHRTGARNAGHCDLRQITNPLEECWDGRQAAFAKLSVKKDSDVVPQVVRRLHQLSQLATIGELETMLVLLPSTASSGSWSDQGQELRRRQAERVMTSFDKQAPAAVPTTSGSEKTMLLASPNSLKACYETKDECMEKTGDCSGHGSCRDKFAKADGSSSSPTCFACHCMSTRRESGGLTHWGGVSCAKRDVSVGFWLFAGFSLALVGILTLSITMLFNVGEEQLPGVIGAGVSRSK